MDISIIISTTDPECARYSLNSPYVREIIVECEGTLTEARNTGAQAAVGDIYAFVDDDVFLGSNWVEACIEAYQSGAIAAGGPALPLWDGRPWYLPRQWDWLVGCGPYHDEMTEVRNTYGCNISFKAEIFDELGGFNENYGKGADLGQREEAEICNRMIQSYGKGVTYHPEMVVHHIVEERQLNYMDLLRRAYEFGLAVKHDGHDVEETRYLAKVIRDPRGWPFIGSVGTGWLTSKTL